MLVSVASTNGTEQQLDLEVAADPSSRIRGLSGRRDPSSLFFDFEQETLVPFTAERCLFDIDAFFFTASGQLVDRLHLPAGQRGPFWPAAKFRYVLESPSGTLDVAALRIR